MTAEVIYVVGTGRSGSTVFANVLGTAPGVFTAGELHFIWQRGFVENRRCSCGSTFSECPMWMEIVRVAEVRTDPVDLARVAADLIRIRNLHRLSRLDNAKSRGPEIADYLSHVERLYEAIATVTNSRYIVDASKHPAYAVVLQSTSASPTGYVHLVRDARGAAFSWRRTRATGALPDDGEPMDRFSVGKGAALWMLWNGFAVLGLKRTRRYLRLRYEDLCEDPAAEIRKLLATLGIESVVPFRDDQSVALEGLHNFAGNPNRLKKGPVRFRADSEWRAAMALPQKMIATCIAFPGLMFFGYLNHANRESGAAHTLEPNRK